VLELEVQSEEVGGVAHLKQRRELLEPRGRLQHLAQAEQEAGLCCLLMSISSLYRVVAVAVVVVLPVWMVLEGGCCGSSCGGAQLRMGEDCFGVGANGGDSAYIMWSIS
jgi:hypothetical protein